jgi:hypothetical protein
MDVCNQNGSAGSKRRATGNVNKQTNKLLSVPMENTDELNTHNLRTRALL